MFNQYVMGVTDFTFVRKLSKGAYGTVFLAKRKDTGKYCAIKVRSCDPSVCLIFHIVIMLCMFLALNFFEHSP